MADGQGGDVAPTIASKLEEIAGVVLTHDDPHDVIDALDLLDHRVGELGRLIGSERSMRRRAAVIEGVDTARRQPLRDGQTLEALRVKINDARAALGAENGPRIACLSERLLQRLHRPPLVHVPTGLATLDAATRGGLLLRRVHVIGGEPDAGKTALLVQMLLEAARRGYAVGIYAVDEPGEGIEDRIGQSLGLALDDMEANVEKAILWLSEAVRDLPNVLLLEQGEQGIETIEDGAEALLKHAKRHACKGAILGIDSIQTATCREFFAERPPRMDRERLDALTKALKAIAKRGLGVIATSELGRASYAAKPGSKTPSPMAAFKGTGSIEYTMTVGIVLSRIAKGEHAGDVRVVIPKNKRGEPGYRGVIIRLERDPDRCTYTDRGRIDEGDGDQPAERGEQQTVVPDKLLERIRHELRKQPRGIDGGTEGLAALVGGNRARTRAGIKKLQAMGEIVRGSGKLFHRDQPVATSTQPEPAAATVRERVLDFVRAETAAGRIVPSASAVFAGLKEAGHGARRSAILDAVHVLVAAGQLLRDGSTLALPPS